MCSLLSAGCVLETNVLAESALLSRAPAPAVPCSSPQVQQPPSVQSLGCARRPAAVPPQFLAVVGWSTQAAAVCVMSSLLTKVVADPEGSTHLCSLSPGSFHL